MLKSYIKIAWRNLNNNRFYAVINVLGLSVSIAFTMLIAVFIWQQYSVNSALRNNDRQFIIQSEWKDPNMGIAFTSFGALAKELKTNYPNLVANYYRWDGITSNVSFADKHFREGIQVGDSTLLSMYGFSVIDGNPNTALNEPFSIVITDEKALKFFGKTNVAGKKLSIESHSGSSHDFNISAVIKKPAKNSITFINEDNDNGIFIPMSNASYFNRGVDSWFNIYIVSFIELKKGVTPKDLIKPMEDLIRKNTVKQISANVQPYLVPLNEYYLDGQGGSVRKMIYTLSVIDLFILGMAIVNFVNISISKSTSRLKEIGIRKVMGGQRKHIIVQFLAEAIMLVFFATLLALLLYTISRSLFSSLLGQQILELTAVPITFLIGIIVFIILIGLLAGFYPALLMSSMHSIDSLKGKLGSIKENILLRKSLMGFQFCTACTVFIGAIIVSQQVSYFLNSNLGYDKDFIVSAQVPRDWTLKGVQHMDALLHEFTSLPAVSKASLSYEIPDGNNGDNVRIWKYGQDAAQAITTVSLKTDMNYASTFGIPILSGSFFSGEKDSLKVVINETSAKSLGWINSESAIGQQLKLDGYNLPFTICGVTKDFHFGSMLTKIDPIIFFNLNYALQYRFLSFKIKPGNIGNSLNAIQNKWSATFPNAAFDYIFMDDALKHLYRSELQLRTASYIATVLSIIIIVLGVIGLVSLSIHKRTKEIGIRKVLGAPIISILFMFLTEFVKVILVAAAIACPIAYLIMKNWLNNYAYQVSLTVNPFALPILALATLTCIIIAVQTFKSALSNPVDCLRTD